MELKLLPSSFEPDGAASKRQHLTCFVINGSVAIDAGSLAMAVTDRERSSIRDIVLTHAHLDHIAGLPLFIDDQFSDLDGPIRIYASDEVIEVLERDVFNWSVYPRFSELTNHFGPVLEYLKLENGVSARIGGLEVTPVSVNHKVPCAGYTIADDTARIAITGDTAEMNGFWDDVGVAGPLSALLVECAFPDVLGDLAAMSHHLTPNTLAGELRKVDHDCPIYVINIKPTYREKVIEQLAKLNDRRLEVLEVGKIYSW